MKRKMNKIKNKIQKQDKRNYIGPADLPPSYTNNSNKCHERLISQLQIKKPEIIKALCNKKSGKIKLSSLKNSIKNLSKEVETKTNVLANSIEKKLVSNINDSQLGNSVRALVQVNNNNIRKISDTINKNIDKLTELNRKNKDIIFDYIANFCKSLFQHLNEINSSVDLTINKIDSSKFKYVKIIHSSMKTVRTSINKQIIKSLEKVNSSITNKVTEYLKVTFLLLLQYWVVVLPVAILAFARFDPKRLAKLLLSVVKFILTQLAKALKSTLSVAINIMKFSFLELIRIIKEEIKRLGLKGFFKEYAMEFVTVLVVFIMIYMIDLL